MSIPKLLIRDVQVSDILEIYRWRNDPITIQYSKTGKGVDRKEHLAWFEGVTSSKKDLTQIGVIRNNPIGIIIFSLKSEANIFEISINLSPEYRKKGCGEIFLSLSEAKLKEKVGECSIRAVILKGNDSSIKFFTKCGYELSQVSQNLLVYEKSLL